ncbi:MAG: branched-chain amino acid ABC transporter permease [Dehalococcoidales bacterium]|nr:branched-chain amino acid ABC transporter permease [Dehalococcoidales bacterium]
MLTSILDVLIAGLLLGGLYALIAMGLSLQYGVARVFNISHGEFIMLGGMATLTLFTVFKINPLIAIVICGPITFVLGYIIHRTFFRHLLTSLPIFGEITILCTLFLWTVFRILADYNYVRLNQFAALAICLVIAIILDFALNRTAFRRIHESRVAAGVFESTSMLFSFGLMFIIKNIAFIGWGPSIRSYSFLQQPVSIAGALFGMNRLVTLGFSILIGLAFYFFLTRTRIGKAIRAAASDPTVAQLMGVNINQVLALCFGLGAAMAGIAGVLISMCYPVNANMGIEYTIIAIIVVALGGLGSIPGSFIGGFALGIIGSIVSFFEPGLALVAYYFIFGLLLLIRPKGILGK